MGLGTAIRRSDYSHHLTPAGAQHCAWRPPARLGGCPDVVSRERSVAAEAERAPQGNGRAHRRRGDRSDAPVGRARTPNVPAAWAGTPRCDSAGPVGRGGSSRGARSGRSPGRGGLRAAPWAAASTRGRRYARIWSITDGCVMQATRRITPWQLGHARGSTSQICWSSVAHRRVASGSASRGADTIVGGPSAAAGSAFPRGRLAYQPYSGEEAGHLRVAPRHKSGQNTCAGASWYASSLQHRHALRTSLARDIPHALQLV